MTSTTPTPSQSRRAALGSFIGAVVEWYDFLLYGIVAALVFGSVFFPDASPQAGLLASFATFGVGFCFRPLGGLIFGHFGDRLGRKRMLIWTMTMMGLATAAIGLLPTYDQIGWFAPLLLVVLRSIQGVAVGGEWGGAALMAVESAPPKLRALFSSGVQVGYSVGLLLATGLTSGLTALLDDDAFQTWGWRIPFLASAILVGVGLWIRSGVAESKVFEQEVEAAPEMKEKSPALAAIKRNPGAIMQIFGMRLGELLTMYIVTTFALSYATDEFGVSRTFMLNLGLVVGGVGILTIPLFAYASDRFGRRPVYLLGAIVGVLASVPFFLALESGSTVLILIGGILLVNVAHDAIVSVQQPLFTELFEPEFRYSGAGIGYQLASAIAGGFTPFIATALVSWGGGSWYLVAAYLAGGCLISTLIALLMKNSDHEPREAQQRAADATVSATARR